MHWFRTNIQLGARLALLALAVQVLLSFGHVHFYGLELVAAKAAPVATVEETDAAMPGKSPPVHKSDGTGLDCAICTLIQFSAHSAPAPSPALPLLADIASSGLHPYIVSAFAASPHFL